MLNTILLGLVCFVSWVLLSGHFSDPLLLGLGFLCSLIVLSLNWRIGRVNFDNSPLNIGFWVRLLHYIPWLVGQMIQSTWEVTRLILDPKLPISPTMFRKPAKQVTELGRVTYANSITLTPGTITIHLSDTDLEVHTLTHRAAEALLEGEMSHRVVRLEGKA